MTLIEVLVAATIIAIMMTFLARGFVTSMYMSRQSDEYAAAARAAREKMEEIFSLTILRYKRTNTAGLTYVLNLDPKTGKYEDEVASFKFNELPVQLTYESVGGPRGGVSVNYTSTSARGFVVSGPGVDLYGRTHPFKVYLSDINPDDPDSNRGILPGIVDDYAGEVVLINSEMLESPVTGAPPLAITTDEHRFGRGAGTYGYGGDIFPRDGRPDGFQFFRLPIDLNGDGDTNDGAAALGVGHTRYAVGVIVRWMGKYGPERHETWTIISQY